MVNNSPAASNDLMQHTLSPTKTDLHLWFYAHTLPGELRLYAWWRDYEPLVAQLYN